MTAPADRFSRSYFFVDEPGEPDGETVARLLEAAATRLRVIGLVSVQDVTFEYGTGAQPLVSLTVYYDRVERRRLDRDPTTSPAA